MNTYVATVPNNHTGKQFIQSLKTFLKGTPRQAIIRGRGHRFGITKFRQDLPIDKAERLAIYIGNRAKVRSKKIAFIQWVQVPTKWA